MSFSPQVLLSKLSKDQCVSKLTRSLFKFDNISKYAAVLVPLCEVDGEVSLLYTLRSSNLKSHSGQISFPGGKADNDETVVETALRETHEEIGVPPEEVEVWESMQPVQGREGMLITPVVGVIRNFDMNKLVVNEDEVEEVFTIPMSSLCDTRNHGYYDFNGLRLSVFTHGKHRVWGITGVITHIFLEAFLPEDVYKFNYKGNKFTLEELMPSKL